MIEVTASTSMRELAERARQAAIGLRTATADQKTRAIQAMAQGLLAQADRILAANARDVAAATAAGLGAAKVDRLKLNEARLAEMARRQGYDAPAIERAVHGKIDISKADDIPVEIISKLGRRFS